MSNTCSAIDSSSPARILSTALHKHEYSLLVVVLGDLIHPCSAMLFLLHSVIGSGRTGVGAAGLALAVTAVYRGTGLGGEE